MSCLSAIEVHALEQLEEDVSRGLAEFLRVGAALAEIRERKLYRGAHANFAAYLTVRWNMSRTKAYRLICASEVADDCRQFGDDVPRSESQLRPLANLDPDGRREAWARAKGMAPQPTAAVVREAANSVRLDRLAAGALARMSAAEQRRALEAGEKAADLRRAVREQEEAQALADRRRAKMIHHGRKMLRLAEVLGISWVVGVLEKTLERLGAAG